MKLCLQQRYPFGFCLLAAVVLIVLAACQTTGVSSPDAMTPVTVPPVVPVAATSDHVITIRFACYEFAYPEFERLAEQFHQAYPGIRIELERIENIIAPTMSDRDFTDDLYRIVAIADTAHWVAVTREGTRQGLVQDLSPFIDADAGFDSKDFYPHILETMQWDGGTWGIPAHGSMVLLFYDKRAFNEAGVPYPETGWDIDDFLNTAQKLVVREGDQVVRYGFAPTARNEIPFLFVEGIANPFAFSASTLDMPNLNSPGVVNALQWYTDLALVYEVMPPYAMISGAILRDDKPYYVWGEEWLKPRKMAMWFDDIANFWLYPNIQELDLDIGIAPLPFGEEALAYLTAQGYIMSSGTAYPTESWQWLRFLSHQQLRDPVTQLLFPARRSLAEAQKYWARWNEADLAVIESAFAHAATAPVNDPVSQGLLRATEMIFTGETVKSALETVQAETQAVYTAWVDTGAREISIAPATAIDDSVVSVQFATLNFDPTGAYHSLAQAFNAEHDDIHVEVVPADTATTAACFSGPASLVQSNDQFKLLNLQPLVDTDVTLNLDCFSFVEAFREQGDLYGLPVLAQPQVLYYNRALFDAAGLPYPTSDWTLEDLRRAAVLLTRSERQQYGFIPLNGAGIDLPLFVTLSSGQLWDAQGRPRFDSPDIIEAVAWYADLIQQAMPPLALESTEDTLAQRERLIAEGRAGMWSVLVNAGIVQTVAPWLNDQIAMAPFPRQVTLISHEGLFINAAASMAEASVCWTWLKYAAVNRPVEPQMGIPAYKTKLASDSFVAQAGPGVVETYRTLENVVSLTIPNRAGTPLQLRDLEEALAQILVGASPEAALAEAQRQARNR